MRPKISETHEARKSLFRKGVQEGRLSVEEIERTLPEGGLTAAERWLFYYSLRAADIEILGEESEISFFQGGEQAETQG
jgi:hypothetical protein